MILGAPQHHGAVAWRLSTSCQPCKTSRKDSLLRSHVIIIIKRKQSSSRKVQKYSTGLSPLVTQPAYCLDDDAKYPIPSFGTRAVPRSVNQSIDVDQTRPAALQSPPALDPKAYPTTNGKPPIADRAKHLFKIGKSYLAFYKTGFKNVWYNYKQTRGILANLAPHSLETAAKYGGQVRSGSQLPTISQAEYQFCVRSQHDIFKLIPFSLVFAICGEFTPLVIIALGTVVVPYTCRIPQQESKDLQKKLQRSKDYTEYMARSSASSPSTHDTKADAPTTSQPPDLSWKQEWLESYRYGLTSFRQPLPIVGYLYHQYILQPRLVKHCNTLLCNTILIHREGGFSRLDARSIFEWADKYSLSTLDDYLSNYITEQKQATKSDSITLSIPKICSADTFKKLLIPACEKESKYILNQDWKHLKPACHWRAAFRSLANDQDRSPDTSDRREQVQKLIESR